MLEGVLIGGYRLVSRLGEGGMGVVWLAEHARLGRRAAVKVLHPRFSADPEIVNRFFNEARAATAISDPGIVQVYDFGNHTDGSAFIVMELLHGEALDARLSRRGTLAPADALRIVRQVASSLGAAHAQNIVHRDLKPENIFIVRDPEVPGGERAKILDFGIAKLIGEGHGVTTKASAVMGTPTYMSPEQCRGAGKVDQRSDVYALGCVLYVLLVGQPPFEAEGLGEVMMMHMMQPPTAPSSRTRGLPPELDALVLRCLAKDPSARFLNGADLAAEIDRLLMRLTPQLRALTGPPIATLPTAPTIASPVGAGPTTLSSSAGQSLPLAPQRKRRTMVIAGTAAALLLASVGIWKATQHGGTETAQVASAGEPPAPVAMRANAPEEVVRPEASAPAPKPAAGVSLPASLSPSPQQANAPTPEPPAPIAAAAVAPIPASPTTPTGVSPSRAIAPSPRTPEPAPAGSVAPSAATAARPVAEIPKAPAPASPSAALVSAAPPPKPTPTTPPSPSPSVRTDEPRAETPQPSASERDSCLKRRSDALKRAQTITDLNLRAQTLKSAPVCDGSQGVRAVVAPPPPSPSSPPAPAPAPAPAPVPAPPKTLPAPAEAGDRTSCLQRRIEVLRNAQKVTDAKERARLLRSAPVCDR